MTQKSFQKGTFPPFVGKVPSSCQAARIARHSRDSLGTTRHGNQFVQIRGIKAAKCWRYPKYMQSYFVISYLWRGKSWWKRGFITCFQNAYCKSSGIWDWVRFPIEPTSMICSWERLRPFLPNTAGGWASWCSQRRLGSTPVRSLQRWSGAGGVAAASHIKCHLRLWFLGDLRKWDRIPFPTENSVPLNPMVCLIIIPMKWL